MSSGAGDGVGRGAVSRRGFLAAVTAGGALAALPGCERGAARPVEMPGGATNVTPCPGPCPAGVVTGHVPILKPTPESDFILHNESNAEMRFEVMARHAGVTPNEAFFVRSHGTTALIDVRKWRLVVDGDGVERPLVLTYDDLLRMPSRSVTRFLECAGNGRAFFGELLHHAAEGDAWRFGAWGIAEWTGVPLQEILRCAGVRPTAAHVTPEALDDVGFARAMPIWKAIEEDTILALRMNGETLPPDHGFPARVVLPGWAGVASVKWVGRLRVTERPVYTEWNTEKYVLIGPNYRPAPPARGPVVTEQVMKSAVALPWGAALRPGRQTVSGWAWSPAGRIAGVDVSLDGGKTFASARLVGPNVGEAGVRWEMSFDARPEHTSLTPRATDEQGRTQPPLDAQKWNEQGYLFAAPVPHPIRVGG